jgi:hypothetical protein
MKTPDVESGEYCVGDTQKIDDGIEIHGQKNIKGGWEVVTLLACCNIFLLRTSSHSSIGLFCAFTSVLVPFIITVRSWTKSPNANSHSIKPVRGIPKYIALAGTVALIFASRMKFPFKFENHSSQMSLSSMTRKQGGGQFQYFGIEQEMKKAANVTTQRYFKLFVDHGRDPVERSFAGDLEDESHGFWRSSNYSDTDEDIAIKQEEEESFSIPDTKVGNTVQTVDGEDRGA